MPFGLYSTISLHLALEKDFVFANGFMASPNVDWNFTEEIRSRNRFVVIASIPITGQRNVAFRRMYAILFPFRGKLIFWILFGGVAKSGQKCEGMGGRCLIS